MPIVDGRVVLEVQCKCGTKTNITSGSLGGYCSNCALPIKTSDYRDQINHEIQKVILDERKRIRKDKKENGEAYHEDYSVGSSVLISACGLCGGSLGGTIYVIDGEPLCQTCYKDKTKKCSGCGTIHLSKHLKNGVCSLCKVSFKDCPSCGHTYDKRLYRTFEIRGKTYCNQCCVTYITKHNLGIQSFSYKPYPVFFGSTGEAGEYHLGAEIEMDNSKRLNEFLCKSHCKEIYYKTDGSLTSGESVETVSHPCTLKYHMEEPMWKRVLDAAHSSGLRSHSGSSRDPTSRSPTCGLHIHVGREAFGATAEERDAREAKLLILFDKFWDQVVIFSRRDKHSLERWAKRYADFDVSKEQLSDIIKKAKGTNGSDRRFAVNICNGTRGAGIGEQNTIEFRVFRGTLNLETLIASFQLIALLVEATNKSTSEVQQLTWEEFRDNGIEKYSEFAGYIKRLQGMKRLI